MPRIRDDRPETGDALTDAALDALDADELRALIRELLPWFDDRLHARFVNAVIDHAARNPSGWVPAAPGEAIVAEIERFADAAQRIGYADPAEVDAWLRVGSNAFLARDYAAAYRIFHALLIPLADAAFDIGQHEMVDEVLGIEVGDCAAQYAVAVYMTAAARHRGRAVLAAFDAVGGVWHFAAPLRELEQAAVESLPGVDDFLLRWREAVAARVAQRGPSDWANQEDRWLHEVVLRIDGPEGLGEIARATCKLHDLRAWCEALAAAGDWSAALAANEAAVECLADRPDACAEFLDGAALAVQQLRGEDLPERLDRAWRASPSLPRLQRWLGSSETPQRMRERVTQALAVCPEPALRQRALLHLLADDPAAGATLLAGAPGLGWSNPEHPGPLLFPLFTAWLGDGESPDGMADADEISSPPAGHDAPRLVTPALSELVALSGVMSSIDPTVRETLIAAMRRAAEQRIAGVTKNSRRRHYGHAASLALTCARVDRSVEAAAWLAAVRQSYRRYPALQREFQQREDAG